MNLKISIPISFGIVMLMISVLKVSVYYKIILKADLSNQKNLIKKGFAIFSTYILKYLISYS